jgi:hypothetical protein
MRGWSLISTSLYTHPRAGWLWQVTRCWGEVMQGDGIKSGQLGKTVRVVCDATLVMKERNHNFDSNNND